MTITSYNHDISKFFYLVQRLDARCNIFNAKKILQCHVFLYTFNDQTKGSYVKSRVSSRSRCVKVSSRLVSSRLDVVTLKSRLVSVSEHRVSTPPLLNKRSTSAFELGGINRLIANVAISLNGFPLEVSL